MLWGMVLLPTQLTLVLGFIANLLRIILFHLSRKDAQPEMGGYGKVIIDDEDEYEIQEDEEEAEGGVPGLRSSSDGDRSRSSRSDLRRRRGVKGARHSSADDGTPLPGSRAARRAAQFGHKRRPEGSGEASGNGSQPIPAFLGGDREGEGSQGRLQSPSIDRQGSSSEEKGGSSTARTGPSATVPNDRSRRDEESSGFGGRLGGRDSSYGNATAARSSRSRGEEESACERRGAKSSSSSSNRALPSSSSDNGVGSSSSKVKEELMRELAALREEKVLVKGSGGKRRRGAGAY
jgi:hypothetical protein